VLVAVSHHRNFYQILRKKLPNCTLRVHPTSLNETYLKAESNCYQLLIRCLNLFRHFLYLPITLSEAPPDASVVRKYNVEWT